VTPATLVSLAVTPTNTNIANGTTRQFTATGTYTDGSAQDLTASVTWSSSSIGVAAVSNAAGFKGLATSVAAGSTTITAASGGVSASTTLTVTATASANSVTLLWDAPTTYTDGTPVTGFVGYKVYYGTASRVYTYVVDVQDKTTHTIDALTPGTTYYFAITAYDSSGIESDFSNELSTTIL
jgi:fibronectin type 3 domain-containing protein